MNNKFCLRCKTNKPLSDFHIRRSSKRDGHCTYCKECQSKYDKTRKRSTKTIIQKSKYYNINKDKILAKNKKWKAENKNRINTYYIKNKKEIFKKERVRYHSDIEYKIAYLLRRRIKNAIKNDQKKGSTLQILGCTVAFLKYHLQQTAINNGYLDFDINNYSGEEYHVDHIIPCAAFNLKCGYHQKICFHWSNLQILEAKQNLEKQAKMAA